jgi:hypothetical protein
VLVVVGVGVLVVVGVWVAVLVGVGVGVVKIGLQVPDTVNPSQS